MRRGEIRWLSFPAPRGSESRFRRPVVVVQSDLFHRGGLRTTIVADLTSNLARAQGPGNTLVASEETGLDRDSVVVGTHLTVVDKDSLEQPVGCLSEELMSEIDEALRLVLDL